MKTAKKSSPRDEFGELLLTEPAPCLGKPFAHINLVALWDGKGGTWRFFGAPPSVGPAQLQEAPVAEEGFPSPRNMHGACQLRAVKPGLPMPGRSKIKQPK